MVVQEDLDDSVDRVYEHRDRRFVDLEKGVSCGAKVSRRWYANFGRFCDR